MISGLLGAYLLIHAGMAVYAVYLVSGALQLPATISDPYIPEMRENYRLLVVTSLVVSVLGAMSAVTSIGFIRNSNWARHLWLVTSSLLFACLVVAVVFLGAAWTSYLYDLGAVIVSWWCLLQFEKERHK